MVAQDVHLTPAKNHRFLLLDALRGIAALLVVIYHAPNYSRWGPLAAQGYLAVDLFFVLSGFVIAFSYERRLQETLSFKTFLVARFIRLYPIYLLGTVIGTLMAFTVVHVQSRSPDHPLTLVLSTLISLLLLPDFFHSGINLNFPFDPPAWSLFCELIANILYAGLVRLKIAKNRVLLPLALLSLTVLLRFLISSPHNVDVGSSRGTFYLGMARVGYSFFLGVILFRFFHSEKRPLFKGRLAWIMSITIGLIVASALGSVLTQRVVPQIIAIVIVFPAIVYFGARVSLPGSFTKTAAFLGDASYPLYLIHLPLYAVFYGHTFTRFRYGFPTVLPFVLPVSILLLVLASWWFARFYDAPVRKLLTARYNRR